MINCGKLVLPSRSQKNYKSQAKFIFILLSDKSSHHEAKKPTPPSQLKFVFIVYWSSKLGSTITKPKKKKNYKSQGKFICIFLLSGKISHQEGKKLQILAKISFYVLLVLENGFYHRGAKETRNPSLKSFHFLLSGKINHHEAKKQQIPAKISYYFLLVVKNGFFCHETKEKLQIPAKISVILYWVSKSAIMKPKNNKSQLKYIFIVYWSRKMGSSVTKPKKEYKYKVKFLFIFYWAAKLVTSKAKELQIPAIICFYFYLSLKLGSTITMPKKPQIHVKIYFYFLLSGKIIAKPKKLQIPAKLFLYCLLVLKIGFYYLEAKKSTNPS